VRERQQCVHPRRSWQQRLAGFAGGAFALAAPLYIVEIAESSMRGSLASMMQFMITLGVAFTDGLNIDDFVHWNIISGICIVFPGQRPDCSDCCTDSYVHSSLAVLLALFMFFMPESPFYLVKKGKDEAAERSLQWLRGPNCDVSHELEQLKAEEKQEREQGSISFGDMFSKGVYLKPLLIINALMFFQQFSGINFVIFYTQEIFKDAGSDIDAGEQRAPPFCRRCPQ
jgi:MFS family permease